MMIQENNLKFLKQYYPNLVTLVDNNREPSQVVGSVTRNNESNMTLIKNGKTYLMHSKYNAVDESQKWATTIRSEIKSSGCVLLFGMGIGYFLEALLELPEVSQVFICEPSAEVFNFLISHRNIRPMLSNSKVKMVAVGSEDLFLLDIANQISTYLSSKNLSIVAAPIYLRMFGNTFEDLTLKIRSTLMDQIANFQTNEKFQNLWTHNILNNLPYTIKYPSFQCFKDLWKDRPAIIVGSGPSLKEDIHYLRRLQNKCLIIAAGSSIQALQHHGIQPHLIVSMDGGLPNLHVFENIDTSQVPLLFISQIYYGILELYEGKMVSALFSNDLISRYLWADRCIPEFYNTSTVTGTAVQAAEFMGSNRIILMGQDLSYPDQEFYAPGVNHIPEHIKNEIIENEDLWVDNVSGGKNRTTQKMMVTLEDLELLVEIETLKEVRFINTSKKGAIIRGTEFQTMDELMDGLLELSSEDINLDKQIVSPSLKEQAQLFAQIKAKLKYIRNQADSLSVRVQQLCDIFLEMQKNVLNRNSSKVKQNLILVDEKWNWITSREVFTEFYSFSRKQYISIYRRHVPIIVETKDPIKKAELIIEHLGNLVRNMQQYIPELQMLLTQTIEKLNGFSIELPEVN